MSADRKPQRSHKLPRLEPGGLVPASGAPWGDRETAGLGAPWQLDANTTDGSTRLGEGAWCELTLSDAGARVGVSKER
jgi:hypothetical protein